MGRPHVPEPRPTDKCEQCMIKFDLSRFSRFWKSCSQGRDAVVDQYICYRCSKMICNECARRRKRVVLCRECSGKEARRRAEVKELRSRLSSSSAASQNRHETGPSPASPVYVPDEHAQEPEAPLPFPTMQPAATPAPAPSPPEDEQPASPPEDEQPASPPVSPELLAPVAVIPIEDPPLSPKTPMSPMMKNAQRVKQQRIIAAAVARMRLRHASAAWNHWMERYELTLEYKSRLGAHGEDDEDSNTGAAAAEDSNKATDQNSGATLPDDSTISDLFERYDLDNSGTLNTHEELEQLSTNLLFKCGFRVQPGVVQDKVAQVEESSMDWDKQAFKEWFSKAFESELLEQTAG